METMREIPNYKGYFATPDGRVYSEKVKRFLKPRNHRGYWSIGISVDGKKKTATVHRLIAFAFVDNPENKKVINHKDGDKKNNNISNLEWCTTSENILHAFKTGLSSPMAGSKHGFAKLTEADIPVIRSLSSQGKSLSQIAGKFKVDIKTVHRIVQGKGWIHVK